MHTAIFWEVFTRCLDGHFLRMLSTILACTSTICVVNQVLSQNGTHLHVREWWRHHCLPPELEWIPPEFLEHISPPDSPLSSRDKSLDVLRSPSILVHLCFSRLHPPLLLYLTLCDSRITIGKSLVFIFLLQHRYDIGRP